MGARKGREEEYPKDISQHTCPVYGIHSAALEPWLILHCCSCISGRTGQTLFLGQWPFLLCPKVGLGLFIFYGDNISFFALDRAIIKYTKLGYFSHVFNIYSACIFYLLLLPSHSVSWAPAVLQNWPPSLLFWKPYFYYWTLSPCSCCLPGDSWTLSHTGSSTDHCCSTWWYLSGNQVWFPS